MTKRRLSSGILDSRKMKSSYQVTPPANRFPGPDLDISPQPSRYLISGNVSRPMMSSSSTEGAFNRGLARRTPRKLVIRRADEGVHSPGVFCDANSTSESAIYLKESLDKLENAVITILKGRPVEDSLEELYRRVETLCRSKTTIGLSLFTMVRDHLTMRAKSIVKRFEGFDGGQSGDTSPSDPVRVLRQLTKAWSLWSKQVDYIRDIFLYLDRGLLAPRGVTHTISYTGTTLFSKYVINHKGMEENYQQGIKQLVFSALDNDKKPQVLLSSLLAMGPTSTERERFLDIVAANLEAYAEEKFVNAPDKDIWEYIHLVVEFMDLVTYLISKFGVPFEREEPVKVRMVQRMIDLPDHQLYKQAEKLFVAVERDDAEAKEALQLASNLYGLSVDKSTICQYFGKHVLSEGVTIVKDGTNVIDRLLKLKASHDIILKNAFRSDPNFDRVVKEKWKEFINHDRSGIVPEQLAKYLDDLLRSGTKGMADSEVDDKLEQLVLIFRFIEGKDVFEAFYKKDFARRLLLNKSSSVDAERGMLARLKRECGPVFTAQLETMFKDMDLSRQHMQSFKPKGPFMDINFNVSVLTQGDWPSYSTLSCNLPENLSSCLAQFEEYFLSLKGGRKISWRHALGHCIVKANFPKGLKELDMTTFQTAIMLLFNDVADATPLTYGQIAASTGLETQELKRTLQSLCNGKVRVLIKNPKGREVDDTDCFYVNLKLNMPAYRLKVNQFQTKETPEEKKVTHQEVHRDRQMETQAAIIRIMKTNKKLKHVELIQKVIDQTKQRGTLNMADIKKNIDKLIDRCYMDRDPDAKDSYVYVS